MDRMQMIKAAAEKAQQKQEFKKTVKRVYSKPNNHYNKLSASVKKAARQSPGSLECFKKENIIINSLTYFDIASDIDIGKVDENYLFEVLSKIDLEDSDALFVSCTALPVLSIIEKLEKKLNKIILSSNQTLIWDALNLIGNKDPVVGFGKIFEVN